VDIKTINPILREVFTAPYERLPYNADIEELLLKEGLVDSIKIEYPLHKNPQYPAWVHLEGRTPHVVFRGVNPFDQPIRVRAGDGKLTYIQPGEKFHTHIVTCLPPHG